MEATEFLRKRLDEEQDLYNRIVANDAVNTEWFCDGDDEVMMWSPNVALSATLRDHGMHTEARDALDYEGEMLHSNAMASFVAYNDPDRLNREIQFKRVLLYNHPDMAGDLAYIVYGNHPEYRHVSV